MQLLRDRFLITVAIVTSIAIFGMFILHKQMETKIQTDSPSEPTTKQPLPSMGPFRVVRVLDGDTIVLDNGETVRLIGVDAPEIHHSEVPVQRFGEEATEFLKRLAEGFECTLEYEPDDIRDKYGRILAYVFVKGRLINAEIISRGYAYAYTRFPFRRQAEFVTLEHEARERQYGLWSLSLRDGRIGNLVNRYESLNLQGRKKLDEILEKLVQEYPFEQEERVIEEKAK